MTKGTPHYLLRHDGGATPVFAIEPIDDPRHRLSQTGQNGDVLLCSGFPAVTGPAAFPVSAALQLNGDLTTLSPERLGQAAQAELEGRNRLAYRSYTLEPDNRICAIADDARQLDAFIDTYGGILAIEPLLLDGCTPEFPGIINLQIADTAAGYRIDYAVRSPVDRARCTYCGRCGPACPEGCISETLFIDFAACTFCRICEKSCPVEAIDVAVVERRTVEIPAIVVIGRTRIDQELSGDSLYREQDITRFLSTLFPYQVEEVITCNRQLCQYSSRSRTCCTTCIELCRHGAVRADQEGIRIDALKCVECGRCVGRCPTGALQHERCPDRVFIEFFRTFPLEPGSLVILGTAAELQRFWWHHQEIRLDRCLFMEFPNIQALSPLHLLFLLAHGAEQVVILQNAEAHNDVLERSADEVNLLVDRLFACGRRIHRVDSALFSARDLDRTSRTITAAIYSELGYVNRRQKFASILEFLTRQSRREPLFKTAELAAVGTIACDTARCSQCLACLNECRIEALSADSSTMSLLWTGALCIGCGCCAAVCPEQALLLTAEASLTTGYFSPAILTRAEPMQCRQCGKVFGTRKSFERVMKILTDRNLAQGGHLEYCENCRVIKLLEVE